MFSLAFSAILLKEKVSLVFSLISVINTIKIMWYLVASHYPLFTYPSNFSFFIIYYKTVYYNVFHRKRAFITFI